MTTALALEEPPELDQAKSWLEHSLLRLISGAQKAVVTAAILLAVSQIIPPVRYVFAGLTDVRSILPELIYDLCSVMLIFLVVRWSLPKVLRANYQVLLDRGRIVPVTIQLGPQPLYQRFTGQSTQPYMIRGAVEGMETLFGSWLPTCPANFRCKNGSHQLRTAFLYGDETLLWDDPAYALIDARNPKKIWLIRQPMRGQK